MPNPRFHPVVRLVLCALTVLIGVAGVSSVIAAIAITSKLATVNWSSTSVAATPNTFSLPPRLMLVLMIAQAPVMIGAVGLCRKILDARSFASLGLRGRGITQIFSGAFCGFLAIAFLFGLLWISGQVQVLGWSQRAQEVGTSGIALRLLLWAVVMLGVGLSEEIVFRGYALHNLSAWLGVDKTGLGAAAIGQGILFALIHLGNMAQTPQNLTYAWQAMPNIFLIGLFFALCAFKTGSLWFPIGFHAAWNFFLGSVFSLPVSGLATFRLFETEVSGSRWLTGGAFGAEGSVLLTIITLVMIYFIRQAPDHPQTLSDIATLHPAAELEDIEVASRAPSLRERKEKRRQQTVTNDSFEGWNDLAPPQRQRYTVYQPGQPMAPIIPETAVSGTFPASAFAQDAASATVAVQGEATMPNTLASSPPAPDTFANYRPPAPPVAEPAPQTVVQPTAPPNAVLEIPASVPSAVPSAPAVAKTASETEKPTPPTSPPAAPTPVAPTSPTVKKPPAPRW